MTPIVPPPPSIAPSATDASERPVSEHHAIEDRATGPPSITRKWRSGVPKGRPRRGHRAALAACVLVTLWGALAAVGTLPAPRPTLVVVPVYLPPIDAEVTGVDAPHPPEANRLFGQPESGAAPAVPAQDSATPAKGPSDRTPANAESDTEGATSNDAAARDTTANDAPGNDAPVNQAGTAQAVTNDQATGKTVDSPADWRAALDRCQRGDRLVLHVASMARVEQDRVLLYGRRGPDIDSRSAVSLPLHDLLVAMRESAAAESLLILEIHWPRVSDEDGGKARLTELNRVLRGQLSRTSDPRRHVLLSSDGSGPARGMCGASRSLLAEILTAGWQSLGAGPQQHAGVPLADLIDWVRPRVQALSPGGGPPQTIEWIPAERPFRLPAPDPRRDLAGTGDRSSVTPAGSMRDAGTGTGAGTGTAAGPEEYPEVLASAWHARRDYLGRLRLPWLPELYEGWGRAILSLESRWRRGEGRADLDAAVAALEASCFRQIDQAVRDRQATRPDSLLLSAAVADPAGRSRVSAAIIDWLRDLAAIPGDAAPELREKAVEAAVKTFSERLGPGERLAGLAALIESWSTARELTPEQLVPVDRLRATIHPEPRFVITQVIHQLANGMPTDTSSAADTSSVAGASTDSAIEATASRFASPRRIAAVLRLHLLQDRLGADAETLAPIAGLAESATRHSAMAQRLFWTPGMTAGDRIDSAIRDALAKMESATTAEDEIARSIRQLDDRIATMRIDASQGLGDTTGCRTPDRQGREVFALSRRLVEAIRRIGPGDGDAEHDTRTTDDEGGARDDVGTLRHLREVSHRQWLEYLVRLGEGTSGEGTTHDASGTARQVSVGLPTGQRAERLHQIRREGREAVWRVSGDDPPAVRLRVQPATDVDTRPGDAATGDGVSTTAWWRQWEALGEQRRELYPDASERFLRWRIAFVGDTRTITALPLYAMFAQMQNVGAGFPPLPLRIAGSAEALTWNRPMATLRLLNLLESDAGEPIRFEFLPPVTDNLTIAPRAGVLGGGDEQSVTLRLTARGGRTPASSPSIRGVWLKLTRGPQSDWVPLAIGDVPVVPPVDIDFGVPLAGAGGSEVTLPFWPSAEPQPLRWQVIGGDPAVKSVVARIESASGAGLSSPPLDVTPGNPTPLQFLPAEKPPANGTNEGDATNQDMRGPWTLTVRDAETQAILRRWGIDSHIRDPRAAVRPGEATYRIADDGTNRLEATLSLDPLPDAGDRAGVSAADPGSATTPYRPRVRMRLRGRSDTGTAGSRRSRLAGQLTPENPSITLYADDLRLREGAMSVRRIPLEVEGDDGLFALECRFSPRPGTVGLDWVRTPELAIEAPDAVVPGEPLEARLIARAMDNGQPLVLELLDSDGGDAAPVWHHPLPSSRSAQAVLEAGSGDTSLLTHVGRNDWRVQVPTEFGSGTYRLRLRTVDKVGLRPLVAEREILLDPDVPESITARGESRPGRKTVWVALRPGPSGVSELSLSPEPAGKEDKPIRVVGRSLDAAGGQWRVDWPAEGRTPGHVTVHLRTGAGRDAESQLAVAWQSLPPSGTVRGKVIEGSIPQPGLDVHLLAGGKMIRSTRSGSDGTFEIAAPPGDYQLHTAKPTTGRVAGAAVSLEDGRATARDLKLTRPRASP